MNRPDSRWRLYLRFAAWTFPGVVLLFFSNLILIPRLEYYLDLADPDRLNSAVFEFLINSTRYFYQQFPLLLAGFALAVGLVEYFGRKRPGLRIGFYEIASWLFNFAVLAHLATVAVCALVLAPLISIEPS